MRRIIFTLLFLPVFTLIAQVNKKGFTPLKPKLVVGIVIDQMRWDYLYRYANHFGNGGFKRMMNEGYNCQNTMVPYTPTVTAAGHTCIYTGSVPNIHGIVGNNWYDGKLHKAVYCTDDYNDTVQSVGTTTKAGQMSPKNMFTTTISDELRIATNFRGKVVGIALKDRGAILPAGHKANAAYWYDSDNASFITSTWYMNTLPAWVTAFNSRKLPDSLMALGWDKLYPKDPYVQSTEDEKIYEGKMNGKTSFPYTFSGNTSKQNWDLIRSTPHGNTLTAEFAKAALLSEGLGKDSITDLLAVSFSSPDYIGHQFGPNSIENEDGYLRLDKELAAFFLFLDKEVGKGQYTVFLSADHAVAHVPGFSTENKLPGGSYSTSVFTREINAGLKEKFGLDSLVVATMNYQVHLNHPLIKQKDLDDEKITEWIIKYLYKQNEVSQAFSLQELMEQPMNKTLQGLIGNGYYPGRSGDVQFIPKPGYVDGGKTGTSHGLWNPYDSHIPLLFMGWGVKHGSTYRETYMTDIAATIAALLNIQMPNGCVGHVITEVL